MNLLNEIYRAWALRREFRTVLAELSAYSDRELTDLGLGRGDVARVAYEEAERRIGAPRRVGAKPAQSWHGRSLPVAR
ncbi:MAG: DUF1127 domain-containing protein [Geminicoccaceae bacterium]